MQHCKEEQSKRSLASPAEPRGFRCLLSFFLRAPKLELSAHVVENGESQLGHHDMYELAQSLQKDNLEIILPSDPMIHFRRVGQLEEEVGRDYADSNLDYVDLLAD